MNELRDTQDQVIFDSEKVERQWVIRVPSTGAGAFEAVRASHYDQLLAANREQKAEIERLNHAAMAVLLGVDTAESNSLRASVGEKPEDALLRRIVAHSESLEKSGELLIDEEYNSIVRGAKALVAPTLPTEKEK